jgi:DNA-binding response OmpR family regulator
MTIVEPGNILIVDDEENIRTGLRAILAKDGHEIRDVATAAAALALLDNFAAETAVIDIRIPGMDGTGLLTLIRQRWPHISVILLTGHGTLETAMIAVNAGASDYLLKPIKPAALRQVVQKALAASRKNRAQHLLINTLRHSLQRLDVLPALPSVTDEMGETVVSSPQSITIGTLHIDLQAHEVTCNGNILNLTPSEYNLLLTLASRPGELIEYSTLVREAIQYEAEKWEAKELIKRHIFTLRHKIEPDSSTPYYIHNVRGVGYRFAKG